MDPKDIFVLDASVAVKWFFTEPASEKAIQFFDRLDRGEIRIVVPEMFFLEVANACWKSVRTRIVPVETAEAYLDRLLGLPLESYADKDLADVALENALRFDISVYDGLYLAVAEIYAAPFVTADRPLFEKCRKRYDFIEYLGDLKL